MIRVPQALPAAALAALAACADPPGDGHGGTAQRNLVVISLDTCRADRLGCYGSERDLTPNLDDLAAESALFTDCLAPSTVTGPSHRTLFTGQLVSRHGVKDNGIGAVSPYTLATVLQQAGWATAAFVAGGPLAAEFGFDQGFDVYQPTVEPEDAKNGTIGLSARAALGWLDANPGRPFFLFLHGFDPHCPYDPPAEVRDRFGGWYEGPFELAGRCGGGGDFEALFEAGELGEDEIRFVRDRYDEQVLAGDLGIGELLDGLRSRGLVDQSVVVFASDHGESLGEHDWIGHARLWEEQFRVPLLLRLPGGAGAGRYDYPVQLHDVMPTVLAALGVPPPEGMQGLDLTPLLRGEEADLPAERPRLTLIKDTESVRFDGRWKLEFRRIEGRALGKILRDLHTDPGETRNFARTPRGRQTFDQLLERYEVWRAGQLEGDERFAAIQTGEELSAEQRAALAELGYVDGD